MVVPPLASASQPPPSPTTLAPGPGFRFHHTDEELVRYYLRLKAFGKPFRLQVVLEIDVYKSKPWELAAMFQEGFPIYSSKFVRFRMGHPKSGLHKKMQTISLFGRTLPKLSQWFR